MFEKFMLFSTPMCPTCNEIKDWLSDKDYAVEYVDTITSEGKDKAREFEIEKIPTMISLDKDGQKAGEAYDLDEVEEMVENRSLTDY